MGLLGWVCREEDMLIGRAALRGNGLFTLCSCFVNVGY